MLSVIVLIVTLCVGLVTSVLGALDVLSDEQAGRITEIAIGVSIAALLVITFTER